MKHPEEILKEAARLADSGQFGPALILCAQLPKPYAADPRLLFTRAMAHRGTGRYDEARRTLESLLRVRPGDPAALFELALVLMRLNRLKEALGAMERAVNLRPGTPALLAGKIKLLILMGDQEAARQTLDAALAVGKDDPSLAVAFAQLAPTLGRESEAVDMLRRILAGITGPSPIIAELHNHLGGLLDKQGDYDGAFAAYERFNLLRRAALPYDADLLDASIDRLIAAATPGAVAALPRSPGSGRRAVLILGMPRSGTTLVEQILGRHPSVAAGGELDEMVKISYGLQKSLLGQVPVLSSLETLTPGAIRRGAQAYDAALRAVHPWSPIVTDKMPMNFLHLHLVQCVAPGARVIHCTRDPVDTCLSCYFQNFAGMNLGFSYDLRDLGRFYRAYRRLMAHWAHVVSLPIHPVSYETMVAEQEATSRAMVRWTGLPWDDACLSFHASTRVALTASNQQVRRPVYATSVFRWKRYQKHLGPLLEAIGI